jgi:hypothetical protein
MKGSKEKNRKRTMHLQRGSRASSTCKEHEKKIKTLGTWEEDRKHQMCMENMQTGLKALGAR